MESLGTFIKSLGGHLAMGLWWTCAPHGEPWPNDQEASPRFEALPLTVWLEQTLLLSLFSSLRGSKGVGQAL